MIITFFMTLDPINICPLLTSTDIETISSVIVITTILFTNLIVFVQEMGGEGTLREVPGKAGGGGERKGLR